MLAHCMFMITKVALKCFFQVHNNAAIVKFSVLGGGNIGDKLVYFVCNKNKLKVGNVKTIFERGLNSAHKKN